MQISMFREGETFRLVFGGKQLKGRQCATIYGKKKTNTQPGSYVRMCCNTHDAGGRHRRAAVSPEGNCGAGAPSPCYVLNFVPRVLPV